MLEENDSDGESGDTDFLLDLEGSDDDDDDLENDSGDQDDEQDEGIANTDERFLFCYVRFNERKRVCYCKLKYGRNNRYYTHS